MFAGQAKLALTGIAVTVLIVRTPFEIPHFHVLPLVGLFTLRRGDTRAAWR